MHTLCSIHLVEKSVLDSHSGCSSVRSGASSFEDLLTAMYYRLRTWTGAEGGIRLSTDDGPPAREFLDEDDDEENEDDEPLPPHYPRAQKFQRPSVPGRPVTAAPVGRPESPTSR